MFSFIFCYRNRPQHLEITIPRIRSMFPKEEIIVVEQNDDSKFRRANLLNEGARIAKNELIVFHDIDYYPTDDVKYYETAAPDVYLPVKTVEFVYNDLTPKPIHEVPGGYRHFRNGVDDNFFGAVTVFLKDSFLKINGFSTQFIGWGFEDADLRERVKHYGLRVNRSANNKFLALDHPDSGPAATDYDFMNNIQLASYSMGHLGEGVNNQTATREFVDSKHSMVDQWLMATDFGTDHVSPPTPFVISATRFEI